jgi:hypothetical protein
MKRSSIILIAVAVLFAGSLVLAQQSSSPKPGDTSNQPAWSAGSYGPMYAAFNDVEATLNKAAQAKDMASMRGLLDQARQKLSTISQRFACPMGASGYGPGMMSGYRGNRPYGMMGGNYGPGMMGYGYGPRSGSGPAQPSNGTSR